MLNQIASARTLTADIASQIEEMIQNGTLVAGQRLPPEEELVEHLKVSPGALRKALTSLRTKGVLTSRRGVGVFVSQYKPQPVFQIQAGDMAALSNMLDLLEFRASVEVECAGLAALRRTSEHLQLIQSARVEMWTAMQEGKSGADADAAFHLYIAQAAQNTYFPNFLNYLNDVLMIPRAQFHEPTSERMNHVYAKSLNEIHFAIERAIIARDAMAARAAMRHHFRIGAEHYRNIMGNVSSTQEYSDQA